MVRKAAKKDVEVIAKLAVLLWNNNAIEDLANEFLEIISKGNAQFFLKYDNSIPVGFA